MSTEDAPRIEDYYRNCDEFTKDLEKALGNKNLTDNAKVFLTTLEEKYKKYGQKAFLSEAQYEWLVMLVVDKRRD